MPSMYETIMELPLFKGIGEEQLSLMLEKTSVEFLKFEDGDVISQADEIVSGVNFILVGRVRRTYMLDNFSLGIDEILGKGAVIGALHLYGLDTKYTATSTALGRVSIMRISKADYMNILLSDRIYMLNFVNYLSAAAQRPRILHQNVKAASIWRSLNTMAFTFASGAAETVMVAGDDAEIAKYCGVSINDFEDWKTAELSRNRIMVNQRGIFLKSLHLMR